MPQPEPISEQPASPEKPDPIVRCESLGMRFPGGTRALDGVGLSIGPGEFVSVIGRSGAGKSTLLRCVNRLLTPTEGRVLLRGEDVTHASGARLRRVRQHVGMIFQQFNLVKRLTVLQNVLTGRLRFNGSPARLAPSLARWFGANEQEIAFESLRQVGIADQAFKRADRLSGGQQQRVAIARTLAQEPEVILADEPIASLDPRSAGEVMDALAGIRDDRGIPIIVNLHQVDVAIRYGSRVVGMAHGRVVFDGPPQELSDEISHRLYHREAGDERAEQPGASPEPNPPTCPQTNAGAPALAGTGME